MQPLLLDVSAITSTEVASTTASSATETGYLNRLKAAIQELAAATQPLADLVLDRAMGVVANRRGIVQ